jgi:enoyl-CoA hydratase
MTGSVTLQATGAAAIAEVVLHNPGKLNAMSVAMWQALPQTFERLHQSPDLRVIVVRGADRQFASRGDVEEFPSFRFQADTLAHFHEEVVLPALQAMLDCDLPVIAHIEGAFAGGGLEIAACCDLRLAARSNGRERYYAYADSAEHREGLAAFNERRAARFGN